MADNTKFCHECGKEVDANGSSMHRLWSSVKTSRV